LTKACVTKKIETSLQENQFVKINKYSTYVSCKQKQQSLEKYKTSVDKHKAKYLTQINTSPPAVQAQIKKTQRKGTSQTIC
jgi:hypothetical protein